MARKCRGYNCGCKNYVRGPVQGAFTVCADCFHCDGTHEKDKDAPVTGATNKVLAEADEASAKAERHVVVYSSATDEKVYETKELREALIKANIPGVGQRGRLKPEQIAKAKELLDA